MSHSTSQRQSRHVFIDAYSVKKDAAEDSVRMNRFLQEARRQFFDSLGRCKVVKITNPDRPQNDGISGMICTSDGHLTCHTFSNRGIMFVDVFNRITPPSSALVQQMLYDYFNPERIDVRGSGAIDGFGTHLVVNVQKSIGYDCANLLIDSLLASIQMTPLCERMHDIHHGRRCGTGILQPITESHVAICSGHDDATIDVFSCKPFDASIALEAIQGFHIDTSDHYIIGRGVQLDNKTF